MSKKTVTFFDIEVLKNYFLLAWMGSDGKVVRIDMRGHDTTMGMKKRTKVSKMLRSGTIVSFNGIMYDMPIITCMLEGLSCSELYETSKRIIDDGVAHWQIYNNKIREIKGLKHIDIMGVASGQASLKMYGARVNSELLWDSPVDWDADMTSDEIKNLRAYCGNDLMLTRNVYNVLIPQLKIRAEMSRKYNMDLMSKSDAQIAEAVIISEIGGGKKAKVPKTITYTAPPWVKFNTPNLARLKEDIESFTFAINPLTGKPVMPDWLDETVIRLGEAQFNIGLGGIHSMESSLTIKSSKHYVMRNADVNSYYPSIIINSKLRPTHLSTKFLGIYEAIVKRRLRAKANGDKVEADTLKIVINGSFGKFGSKYSKLYAPELLIATTFTGQLALMMLIESLEENYIPVMSANTDGVEYLCPRKKMDLALKLISEWEKATGYKMSHGEYISLHARDVNNYIAKYDGEVKCKGAFAETTLSKNPQVPICFDAVREFINTGVDIVDTIRNCKDVYKFLSCRQVNGGATWRHKHLGKVVRWYYSTEGDAMHYAKPNKTGNFNTVPLTGGCVPMLDLKKKIPKDIDYPYYIEYAKRMLADLG